MSAFTDILDRLSGVALVNSRLQETNRNVDRALTWLFDHEKRLIRLEAGNPAEGPADKPPSKRLPRKK